MANLDLIQMSLFSLFKSSIFIKIVFSLFLVSFFPFVFCVCPSSVYNQSAIVFGGTTSGSWSTACEIALTSDFSIRDSFLQNYLANSPCVGSSWGPAPPLFPSVGVPSGCDASTWTQRRLLAVVAKIAAAKPNYCHHHLYSWSPSQSDPASYFVVQDICASPSNPNSICVNNTVAASLYNGFDCSDFSSFTYNYGFGAIYATGIGEQACGTSAPGITLPYSVNEIFNQNPASPIMNPGDTLYVGSLNGGAIDVSHVIIWTGIQADFTNTSSPYYINTLISSMDAPCKWAAAWEIANPRISSNLPIWVIIDSTNFGVNYRPFVGWYVQTFSHARRSLVSVSDPNLLSMYPHNNASLVYSGSSCRNTVPILFTGLTNGSSIAPPIVTSTVGPTASSSLQPTTTSSATTSIPGASFFPNIMIAFGIVVLILSM